jgi:hypothetical protein
VENDHLAGRERDNNLTLLWVLGKYIQNIERVGDSGVGRFFFCAVASNNKAYY